MDKSSVVYRCSDSSFYIHVLQPDLTLAYTLLTKAALFRTSYLFDCLASTYRCWRVTQTTCNSRPQARILAANCDGKHSSSIDSEREQSHAQPTPGKTTFL